MITEPAHGAIDIEINSLVLNGFHASDRYRISAAFEGELTRLIQEEGLPEIRQADLNLTSLDAGNVQVSAGASPAKIGAQIARSLYQHIIEAMKGNQHD
jgi:hypothetical protein